MCNTTHVGLEYNDCRLTNEFTWVCYPYFEWIPHYANVCKIKAFCAKDISLSLSLFFLKLKHKWNQIQEQEHQGNMWLSHLLSFWGSFLQDLRVTAGALGVEATWKFKQHSMPSSELSKHAASRNDFSVGSRPTSWCFRFTLKIKDGRKRTNEQVFEGWWITFQKSL